MFQISDRSINLVLNSVVMSVRIAGSLYAVSILPYARSFTTDDYGFSSLCLNGGGTGLLTREPYFSDFVLKLAISYAGKLQAMRGAMADICDVVVSMNLPL
jgi:hypothetical protein